MQPRRLVALIDLLETSSLWKRDAHQQLPLRAATIEELQLVHKADYIAAVQHLSTAKAGENQDTARAGDRRDQELALKYGFGEGDTPALPNIHEVSALIAGERW